MKKIIFVFSVIWCYALGQHALTLAKAQEDPLTATAEMSGTVADSPISGVVTLTESPQGLIIEAEFENVPHPGEHGFHIHENGSCDEMGKAAGGHYNPAKVMHGMLATDGLEHAHAGDMGNIVVDKNGRAKLKTTLPQITLAGGLYNVVGLAIILHEKADDMGQPTGNAGGRIACGIIEVENDIED